MNDNSIKCWGKNGNGQLGYGDVLTRGDENNEMGDNLNSVDFGTGSVLSIEVGALYSCVVLSTFNVRCWGDNAEGFYLDFFSFFDINKHSIYFIIGQLGKGHANDIGIDSNEMGNYLSDINFGAGNDVKRVNGGYLHICAIFNSNNIKCWGRNSSGHLGYGDAINRGDGSNEIKYINYQLQPKVNL